MVYWSITRNCFQFCFITNGLLSLIFPALIIPSQAYAEQNRFWEYCKDGSSQYQHCDEVKKICEQIAAIKIPLQDKPNDQEKKALAGCSSDKLYYGYSKLSEPVMARKCAYLQIEQNSIDGPFDGIPILMTVYANGEGVKRNLALALKFACEDAGAAAPMEYEGRVAHLNQMRQGQDTNHFDYCNDTTSGMMQGYCSSRQADIESARRNEAYKSLTFKWTVSDKRAYEKMRVSWKAYLKAREDEIDQSGSARGAMIVEDQEELEQNFFNQLSFFENGDLPKFSDQDYIKSDQELNLLYKKIQSSTESTVAGTVTKEGIRAAQRAWLKYRDAWIIFAKQKYPSVSEFSWKTQLTNERVDLLEEFNI